MHCFLRSKIFPINFFFSLKASVPPFSAQTHTDRDTHSFLCAFAHYPTFPNFLTCHFSKASPRSPVCICDVSLSVAMPLYSHALHSIHLCLSPASPRSPHPSLLLPYSYPLSFLSASLCCVSWQPSFSLTRRGESANTTVRCINRGAYERLCFFFLLFFLIYSLLHIMLHHSQAKLGARLSCQIF